MRWLALLVAMMLSLLAAPSWAQDAADDPAAKFERGQQLFLDGRYAEALPLFRDALGASGSPNARLYVARCLYELGELLEAHREMRRTVEDARGDDKYSATHEAAAKELDEVAAKLGRITVHVRGAPPDLAVALDDRPLAPSELGQPMVVAPGTHRVVARAAGMPDASRVVEVAAGQSVEVPLSFEARPVHRPRPVMPREEEGFWNPMNIAGVVTAGVGVTGMVLFGVFGARVLSLQGELDDGCGGHCTDPAYDETIEDGRTAQRIANISAGIGAAALVTGGALILFGSLDGGDEAALVVRPTLGGALMHGRF